MRSVFLWRRLEFLVCLGGCPAGGEAGFAVSLHATCRRTMPIFNSSMLLPLQVLKLSATQAVVHMRCLLADRIRRAVTHVVVRLRAHGLVRRALSSPVHKEWNPGSCIISTTFVTP